MRKLFATLILLLLTSTAAWAIDYPSADGYVTDQADFLSDSEEQSIEQQLSDYEARTTIEVAVATVNTLQGVDSDSYAINLANIWGVGDRASNNGVIILVAKQERKLALWFGDGYETSWSNRQSRSIRENTMVPQLKNKQPNQALIAGVNKTIDVLDAGGYGTKWVPGAAPTRPAEPIAQNNYVPPVRPTYTPPVPRKPMDPATKRAIWTWFWLILSGAGLGFLWYRRNQDKLVRAGLAGTISSLVEDMSHNIEKASAAEATLRANYAESVWSTAVSAMNNAKMERLIYADPKDPKTPISELERNVSDLQTCIHSCQGVIATLSQLETAREESASMLAEIPALIETTRTALEHPDVLPETRKTLGQYEAKLKFCQESSQNSKVINWIALHGQLRELRAGLQVLRNEAKSDIAKVAQAREAIPAMFEKAEKNLAKAKKHEGRYKDVDKKLADAERRLQEARQMQTQTGNNGMSSMDYLILYSILNDSASHSRAAEARYDDNVRPDPVYIPSSSSSSHRSSSSSSSSGFGGSSYSGGGGSSSWDSGSSFGGGSFGGSDSGGSSGGGGGSSDW